MTTRSKMVRPGAGLVFGDSKRLFAAFMEHLPGCAWIKTRQGRYVYYNRMMAQIPELGSKALGKRDSDIWPPRIARNYRANDLRVIAQGKALQTVERYLTKQGEGFAAVTKFPIRNPAGKVVMVGGASFDITGRIRAEAAVRDLTMRLSKAEDEERRRIARELHDSTAQKLGGLVMELGRLEEIVARVRPARTILRNCRRLAEDCSDEVRTLSYLLHPPLLDELGLAGALRSYVEGFSVRSHIPVRLKTPRTLPKLSYEIELTLFRVVQESLANILRHSGSSRAAIEIRVRRSQITVTVRDWGRGLSAQELKEGARPGRWRNVGVGLSGMEERLKPLGGTIELRSHRAGTELQAIVPIPPGRRAGNHEK